MSITKQTIKEQILAIKKSESESESELLIDGDLIARIVNNEDVYMYTSVLNKNEAIALANKILEVWDENS
jgi:hypothetical protein